MMTRPSEQTESARFVIDDDALDGLVGNLFSDLCASGFSAEYTDFIALWAGVAADGHRPFEPVVTITDRPDRGTLGIRFSRAFKKEIMFRALDRGLMGGTA